MKRLITALALILCPLTVQAQNVRMERSSWNTATVGTLTVTGQILAPAGSFSAPSYSFSGDPNTGIYSYSADNLALVTGGSIRAIFNNTGLYYYQGTVLLGSSSDAVFMRIAADHIGMIRSTNPQKWSVAGTWTDASNYERGFLSAGTTGLIIGHEANGTGTKREVRVQSNAKNVAVFSGTTVTMTDETAVTVLSVTVPDNSMCQITFEYGNIVVSASEYQGHDGTVSLLVGEDPDAADSYSCSVEEETEHVLASAGTLTDSWGCTAGATTTVAGNFNSTLDVAGSLTLNVTHSSGCVITIP